MSTSFPYVENLPLAILVDAISVFEEAFKSIEVSKIKLGMARRRMVMYFFENYSVLSTLDELKLLNKISMEL